MKRLLISLTVLFIVTLSYAQKESKRSMNDSILSEINRAIIDYKLINDYIGKYKIYQTDNIYILLKLDTSTGVIKMVQWNLDSSKEFEAYLNINDLSGGELQEKGRFELYPTKNMYQFILLDTMFGNTWHVQWGTKLSENWIRQIPR